MIVRVIPPYSQLNTELAILSIYGEPVVDIKADSVSNCDLGCIEKDKV